MILKVLQKFSVYCESYQVWQHVSFMWVSSDQSSLIVSLVLVSVATKCQAIKVSKCQTMLLFFTFRLRKSLQSDAVLPPTYVIGLIHLNVFFFMFPSLYCVFTLATISLQSRSDVSVFGSTSVSYFQ